MATAATPANLTDVQEAEIDIVVANENDQQEKKLELPSPIEFIELAIVSICIALINLTLSLIFPTLMFIHHYEWNRTHEKNKVANTQKSSPVATYYGSFLLPVFHVLICTMGSYGLIKIWQKISWLMIMFPVYFSLPFTIIMFACVIRSKIVQNAVRSVLEDENTTLDSTISSFCLKCIHITGILQRLMLSIILSWIKSENFGITAYMFPSSPQKDTDNEKKLIIQQQLKHTLCQEIKQTFAQKQQQEQMTDQEEKQKENDLSEDYIIC